MNKEKSVNKLKQLEDVTKEEIFQYWIKDTPLERIVAAQEDVQIVEKQKDYLYVKLTTSKTKPGGDTREVIKVKIRTDGNNKINSLRSEIKDDEQRTAYSKILFQILLPWVKARGFATIRFPVPEGVVNIGQRQSNPKEFILHILESLKEQGIRVDYEIEPYQYKDHESISMSYFHQIVVNLRTFGEKNKRNKVIGFITMTVLTICSSCRSSLPRILEENNRNETIQLPPLIDVSHISPQIDEISYLIFFEDNYGSAFRISEDLFITNYHVIFDKAGNKFQRNGVLQQQSMRGNFLRGKSFFEVVDIDPANDIALLRRRGPTVEELFNVWGLLKISFSAENYFEEFYKKGGPLNTKRIGFMPLPIWLVFVAISQAYYLDPFSYGDQIIFDSDDPKIGDEVVHYVRINEKDLIVDEKEVFVHLQLFNDFLGQPLWGSRQLTADRQYIRSDGKVEKLTSEDFPTQNHVYTSVPGVLGVSGSILFNLHELEEGGVLSIIGILSMIERDWSINMPKNKLITYDPAIFARSRIWGGSIFVRASVLKSFIDQYESDMEIKGEDLNEGQRDWKSKRVHQKKKDVKNQAKTKKPGFKLLNKEGTEVDTGEKDKEEPQSDSASMQAMAAIPLLVIFSQLEGWGDVVYSGILLKWLGLLVVKLGIITLGLMTMLGLNIVVGYHIFKFIRNGNFKASEYLFSPLKRALFFLSSFGIIFETLRFNEQKIIRYLPVILSPFILSIFANIDWIEPNLLAVLLTSVLIILFELRYSGKLNFRTSNQDIRGEVQGQSASIEVEPYKKYFTDNFLQELTRKLSIDAGIAPVVFDGMKATGKTTLARDLKTYLEKQDISVIPIEKHWFKNRPRTVWQIIMFVMGYSLIPFFIVFAFLGGPFKYLSEKFIIHTLIDMQKVNQFLNILNKAKKDIKENPESVFTFNWSEIPGIRREDKEEEISRNTVLLFDGTMSSRMFSTVDNQKTVLLTTKVKILRQRLIQRDITSVILKKGYLPWIKLFETYFLRLLYVNRISIWLLNKGHVNFNYVLHTDDFDDLKLEESFKKQEKIDFDFGQKTFEETTKEDIFHYWIKGTPLEDIVRSSDDIDVRFTKIATTILNVGIKVSSLDQSDLEKEEIFSFTIIADGKNIIALRGHSANGILTRKQKELFFKAQLSWLKNLGFKEVKIFLFDENSKPFFLNLFKKWSQEGLDIKFKFLEKDFRGVIIVTLNKVENTLCNCLTDELERQKELKALKKLRDESKREDVIEIDGFNRPFISVGKSAAAIGADLAHRINIEKVGEFEGHTLYHVVSHQTNLTLFDVKDKNALVGAEPSVFYRKKIKERKFGFLFEMPDRANKGRFKQAKEILADVKKLDGFVQNITRMSPNKRNLQLRIYVLAVLYIFQYKYALLNKEQYQTLVRYYMTNTRFARTSILVAANSTMMINLEIIANIYDSRELIGFIAHEVSHKLSLARGYLDETISEIAKMMMYEEMEWFDVIENTQIINIYKERAAVLRSHPRLGWDNHAKGYGRLRIFIDQIQSKGRTIWWGILYGLTIKLWRVKDDRGVHLSKMGAPFMSVLNKRYDRYYESQFCNCLTDELKKQKQYEVLKQLRKSIRDQDIIAVDDFDQPFLFVNRATNSMRYGVSKNIYVIPMGEYYGFELFHTVSYKTEKTLWDVKGESSLVGSEPKMYLDDQVEQIIKTESRIYWKRVSKEVRRKLLQKLASQVGKMVTELITTDFKVSIPSLGGKTLGGMLGFYQATVKVGEDALGYFKKDLGFKDKRKAVSALKDDVKERLINYLRRFYASKKRTKEQLIGGVKRITGRTYTWYSLSQMVTVFRSQGIEIPKRSIHIDRNIREQALRVKAAEYLTGAYPIAEEGEIITNLRAIGFKTPKFQSVKDLVQNLKRRRLMDKAVRRRFVLNATEEQRKEKKKRKRALYLKYYAYVPREFFLLMHKLLIGNEIVWKTVQRYADLYRKAGMKIPEREKKYVQADSLVSLTNVNQDALKEVAILTILKVVDQEVINDLLESVKDDENISEYIPSSDRPFIVYALRHLSIPVYLNNRYQLRQFLGSLISALHQSHIIQRMFETHRVVPSNVFHSSIEDEMMFLTGTYEKTARSINIPPYFLVPRPGVEFNEAKRNFILLTLILAVYRVSSKSNITNASITRVFVHMLNSESLSDAVSLMAKFIDDVEEEISGRKKDDIYLDRKMKELICRNCLVEAQEELKWSRSRDVVSEWVENGLKKSKTKEVRGKLLINLPFAIKQLRKMHSDNFKIYKGEEENAFYLHILKDAYIKFEKQPLGDVKNNYHATVVTTLPENLKPLVYKDFMEELDEDMWIGAQKDPFDNELDFANLSMADNLARKSTDTTNTYVLLAKTKLTREHHDAKWIVAFRVIRNVLHVRNDGPHTLPQDPSEHFFIDNQVLIDDLVFLVEQYLLKRDPLLLWTIATALDPALYPEYYPTLHGFDPKRKFDMNLHYLATRKHLLEKLKEKFSAWQLSKLLLVIIFKFSWGRFPKPWEPHLSFVDLSWRNDFILERLFKVRYKSDRSSKTKKMFKRQLRKDLLSVLIEKWRLWFKFIFGNWLRS